MKKTTIFIVLFEIATISALLYSLYQMSSLNENLYISSKQRLAMLQAADRLRHSSDDLTNFARVYVVTGDEKFKKQYFDTLAIRNGKLPRPKDYQALYWDLSPQERAKKHPPTKKISLDEIFSKLPFTKKELSLLQKSHKNSDDLVNLEVEAF
ncbi:MAG: methyl-accepting chemotaxis protein, partial [Epsilonproteobacteria bacterium]|nr:methyl-accepting chemotaxis protein [Campylobacterota bacterium]